MEHFLLTFSSVNCNSLNLASAREIQEKKLYAILSLKSDIIFLSDIRTSNNSSKDCLTNITNTLATNPYASYKPIFNSTQNKRGVGILIKNTCDISDINVIRDTSENYILALLQHNTTGSRIIVGSIYGPNSNNPEFFAQLEADLRKLGNYPIVIGGDWNCTVSSLQANLNPDCLDMAEIPNKRHSEILEGMTNRLRLTDPYRLLHPAKSDFTYVPRSILQTNRSRIDFFLISESTTEWLNCCEIDRALLSKAFDHKAILLSFAKPVLKTKFNQAVSHDTINNPDTGMIVQTALIEAYFNHADPIFLQRNFPGTDFNAITGRIWTGIRNIIPDPERYPELQPENERINERAAQIAELTNLLTGIDLNTLQAAPLTCSDTTFYDTLLNNIRNEVISYQSYIRKRQKIFFTEMATIIDQEKDKAQPDMALVAEAELKLTKYRDLFLDSELKKFSIYEHLHEEKITPAFLKIASARKTDKDLGLIVNSEGVPFPNDEDRNNYIRNYFAAVYREPAPDLEVTVDTIRDFLGPQVLATRQVQASILSEQEKNSLEGNLTIHELEMALKDSKTNSASGSDGINYAFIKKFWNLLKTPLTRYATEAFRTGALTDNFRTANIKLIPKKGDNTSIKNWRPISLLNCSYKIISRAINNRLKKFSDKILGRAQKGFSNTRKIHEVIINVTEAIAESNANNRPMAVLALDQAKAFDSINHKYLQACLEFFNFGPNFRNMIKTIATNRLACIILPNGLVSANFPLERGNAQGDSPSPLLFNIANQILLLKLDLDLNIKGIGSIKWQHLPNLLPGQVPEPVPDPAPVPALIPNEDNWFPNNNNNFSTECNRETATMNCFADDATGNMTPTLQNLENVKTVLQNFAQISGLTCNFDKTSIMLVGFGDNPKPDLTTLGFMVTESIKILGFEISNDLTTLQQHFDTAAQKIVKIIAFWSRFRLSMPGRIAIAKTFLYSQVAYYGAVLLPSKEQTKTLNNLIFRYVSGTRPIATDKLILPVSKGGLGLFDCSEYCKALHCSLVKYANNFPIDNWSYDLMKVSSGNPLTLNPRTINQRTNPILFTLATSWEEFLTRFYKIDLNIGRGFIFNNPQIPRSGHDTGLLCSAFFRQNPPLRLSQVSKIKLSDITRNGHIMPIHEINQSTGLNFSPAVYLRLTTAVENRLQGRLVDNQNSTPISVFVNRFKKGSSQFRKIISRTGASKGNFTSLTTFCRLAEIADPLEDKKHTVVAQWNNNALPRRLQGFWYQWLNNRLPINIRLAHLINTPVDRSCTFCTLEKNFPVQEETFAHLFRYCPTISKIRAWFLATFLPEWSTKPEHEQSRLLFLCVETDGNLLPVPVLVTCVTFWKKIWEAHQVKKIPSTTTLKTNITYELRKLGSSLSFQRILLTANNYFLCRTWNELIAR